MFSERCFRWALVLVSAGLASGAIFATALGSLSVTAMIWILGFAAMGGLLAFVLEEADPQLLAAQWRRQVALRFDRRSPTSWRKATAPPEACAICLDVLLPGHPCRQLSCNHTFHVGCIDQWWVKQDPTLVAGNCPLCRSDCPDLPVGGEEAAAKVGGNDDGGEALEVGPIITSDPPLTARVERMECTDPGPGRGEEDLEAQDLSSCSACESPPFKCDASKREGSPAVATAGVVVTSVVIEATA
mmetsp:Transcript_119720/g.298608  ORF Transcript_119720/g.298608 Transcript_119720/m.298608 type:complete len:244 (-) Transcript_119720:162-893(-)